MNRFILLGGAFLLLFAARDAAAQVFISPFVGTTLSSPTATGSSTKPGFGVAFGGLGKFVGGETEIAYYPAVIDNSTNALAKSRVISFSGDTLIGPTIGRVKGGASDFMRNRSITAKCAICGRAYCLLWCRGGNRTYTPLAGPRILSRGNVGITKDLQATGRTVHWDRSTFSVRHCPTLTRD